MLLYALYKSVKIYMLPVDLRFFAVKLLVGCFLVSSCVEKNDDVSPSSTQPEPVYSMCRVKKDSSVFLGIVTTVTYDSLGREIEYEYVYRKGSPSEKKFTSSIDYNAAGQMTKITNGNYNYFTFEYSADGRVSKRIFHDTSGDLLSLEPANTTFEYDAEGRCVREIFDSSTSARYVYNADGNMSQRYSRFRESEYLAIHNLRFDDKHAVWGNIVSRITLDSQGVSRAEARYMPIIQKNNVLRVNTYLSDGRLAWADSTVFIYNSSGYPIQVIHGADKALYDVITYDCH